MKVVISGSTDVIAFIRSLYESHTLEGIVGLAASIEDYEAPAELNIGMAAQARPVARNYGSGTTKAVLAEYSPKQAHISSMTNAGLVELMAKQAQISKAAASRALEAIVSGIRTTLKKNNSVSLAGFGTFSVVKRPARSGRNPLTGASIRINAAKVKFRPSNALKETIN